MGGWDGDEHERSGSEAGGGQTLQGVVSRITFRNPQTGFTVLRLQVGGGVPDGAGRTDALFGRGPGSPGGAEGDPAGAGTVTVVGYFPDVPHGETVRVEGEWVTHPRYGPQFQARTFHVVTPETELGIRRYLASGIVKGIGPALAERLVAHFGLDTLDVIEREPERLLDVPGIGPKKAEAIRRGLAGRRSMERVMVFLQGHGVSAAYAARIWREYGDAAVEVVKENPYRLAHDVFGIGFVTADRLARSLGVDASSPQRLRAGLLYVLDRASQEGHVYLPRGELVGAAAKALDVDPEHVSAALGDAVRAGVLVARRPPGDGETGLALPEDEAIYLPEMEAAEGAVAAWLARLAAAGSRLRGTGGDGAARGDDDDSLTRRAIRIAAERAGLTLTPEQEQAVEAGLDAGVLVITGGPGTGKTTIVRVLLSLLKGLKQSVGLACPTGRAAQRLQEATGEPARTIHRLLEFGYEEGRGLVFQRREDNPLDYDVVLIDEASMVDLRLMFHLLRALQAGTRLILIGDVDQLPSVGPGDVLRDVIRSGAVRTVRLQRVFRQEEDSGIVQAAHAIVAGRDPLAERTGDDFYLLEEDDPEAIAHTIVDLVSRRLPAYLGVDPVDDIQVLSPMRRGVTGVENLNRLLQERLNPPAEPAPSGGAAPPFRLGDKVMQTRNNYRKRVFNGDIGRVAAWDAEEGVLRVAFPAPEGTMWVDYDASDWDELSLAYCISVHKSQGSEYPAIVMPMTTQHYVMLRRNLLYTAVTRARRLAVLVGTRRALRIALSQTSEERRYTLLAPRLREAAATLGFLHGDG